MLELLSSERKKIDKNHNEMIHKAIGTFLVIIAGLLFFLDKILFFFGIQGQNTFGFTNFSNFIWATSQGIIPIILTVGIIFRPYIVSIIVPLYCSILHLVWIFSNDNYHTDQSFFYLYALAFSFCFFFLLLIIRHFFKMNFRHKTDLGIFIENANSFINDLESEIDFLVIKFKKNEMSLEDVLSEFDTVSSKFKKKTKKNAFLINLLESTIYKATCKLSASKNIINEIDQNKEIYEKLRKDLGIN